MAIIMSVFLGGCSNPQKLDPFAGLDITAEQAAFPNLTVAVIVSQNTKNTRTFGKKWGDLWGVDSEGIIIQGIDVFRKNFKSAVRIDRIEDAKSLNADMVAILDWRLYAEAGGLWHFDTDAIMVTLDQSPIDTISSNNERVINTFLVAKTMREWSGEVWRRFGFKLRSSQKLAEFAKDKAGLSKETVAAMTTLPRPKVFHSDIDSPGYKSPENPENFALVIGIEKYANLPQADFAERDAQTAREHLIALGYPSRNIIFLTGQQAGKSGIEKYVEEWLPRNVKENSKVVVYFSGHGAPGVSNSQAYLVPWDGDPKFLETTGYPVKRLYEKLNVLKAKNVIVAMDSCFSGVGGRSVLAQGLRPLVTRVDTGAQSVGKLIIFSASASDEATGVANDQGHGLFSYYFLKGLSEKRGDATIKDLYDYLLPHVQEDARRDNRDQTPQLMPVVLGEKAGLRLK